tara:strand:+ start:34 stop:612 length:579 start_codon:yes stop_codon:yes gene_type:complete
MLPEQIDIWTGQPLNDVDNPFLRILNAISPVQISGTAEPWRQWLLETGWDGLPMLAKDSSGSITWTADEREEINRYIGEQQIYKQLERLMKSKKYKEDLEQLRVHRSTNADLNDDIVKIKSSMLPLYTEIDRIVSTAQKTAEARFFANNPERSEDVRLQQITNKQMKQGNVPGAIRTQKKSIETQQLLQMSK